MTPESVAFPPVVHVTLHGLGEHAHVSVSVLTFTATGTMLGSVTAGANTRLVESSDSVEPCEMPFTVTDSAGRVTVKDTL